MPTCCVMWKCFLGLNDGQSEPQGENESQSHAAQEFAPQGKDSLPGSKNYELSIAGVKGSEHGAISILDVNALPSQPAANEPVKVTVHLQSPEGIKSASVKYGLSELPLTRQDMLSVDRVYDCALTSGIGQPRRRILERHHSRPGCRHLHASFRLYNGRIEHCRRRALFDPLEHSQLRPRNGRSSPPPPEETACSSLSPHP